MGKTTAIAWTDATWNPWQGCTKVSPGCKFCYMYREKERYGQDPTVVVRSKPPTFNAPLKWPDARTIFTCSWSDFFHEAADPWRTDAWEIIRSTPHHLYLILTKRPERMAGRLPWGPFGDPWPNVWLGVSVETAAYYTRLDMLMTTPAAHRFVSAEPLLGRLDLEPWLRPGHLDWVIVGGESGAAARPMHVTWLRYLVWQCQRRAVPIFVKQDSGPRPGLRGAIPDDLWVQELPR